MEIATAEAAVVDLAAAPVVAATAIGGKRLTGHHRAVWAALPPMLAWLF